MTTRITNLLLDLLTTRITATTSRTSTEDEQQHDSPGDDLLDVVLSCLEVGELRAVAVTCRALRQRAIQENKKNQRRGGAAVVGSVHRLAVLFADNNHVPCRVVDSRQYHQQQLDRCQRFLDEDEVLRRAIFQPQPSRQVCKHGIPAILRRGRFNFVDGDYEKRIAPDKYFFACGKERKRKKEEEENTEENMKCDHFQWATAPEQDEALQHGSFVIQFDNKTVLRLETPNGLLTDMEQVHDYSCQAYFRRNYQTGYLLIKKLVNHRSATAHGQYLRRLDGQDYWAMEVWENTTTERNGEPKAYPMTHPTVHHASPAAAQAFCSDATAAKKIEGFAEDEDVRAVQFFLVTYDLTPWLNHNKRISSSNNNKRNKNGYCVEHDMSPLAPKQMLFIGQHGLDTIDFSDIGRFSLSRDGRTLAVWVAAHGSNSISSVENSHKRDAGSFKVWIFHQKDRLEVAAATKTTSTQGDEGAFFVPMSFSKRPHDIFVGLRVSAIDTDCYSLDVAVSADGNMIAGYFTQFSNFPCLQVFDTRAGGIAQPLMEMPLYCLHSDAEFDFVQYAFCRENRIALRCETKEEVLKEFVEQGQTFPAIVDFTVLYSEVRQSSGFTFEDGDARGDKCGSQCYRDTLLHDYEQVKREQTTYKSNENQTAEFVYPCRCCGNEFVCPEAILRRYYVTHCTCSVCGWQVQFPHEDERGFKFDDIFH